jgi:hypothetical protein
MPDDDDFPDRAFEDHVSLLAQLELMDTVVETEATNGGQASLHYKGLRYAERGTEVSIVGKGYAVEQHPDFLRKLGGTLQERSITPRGTIRESARGVLHASIHFFNPLYDVARIVGALEPTMTCHLGLLAGNSHGAPSTCLSLEAMAESSDGTRYLVGDLLGRVSIRHVGKLNRQTGRLIAEMLAGLPSLGRHCRDARETPLERPQGEEILRGLEYGPGARNAILARKPQSMWTLYDGCCRFAKRLAVGEATRIAELRRCQAILQPNKREAAQEAGRLAILEEHAREQQSRNLPPAQTHLELEAPVPA